jgi:hypothetical protein
MSAPTFPGLGRLTRLFTRMIYLGCAFVAAGVVLGVLLPDGAGPAVMGAGVASGLLMVVVGARGRRRGHAEMARLRGSSGTSAV